MKKTLILILSLFFTFVFNNLYAEIINKVEVTGNDRVGKETIIVYGDIKVGKDYGPVEINNITKNLFETNFFENIEIELNNGLLSINVKEYPVIHTIILEGEKHNCPSLEPQAEQDVWISLYSAMILVSFCHNI